MTKLSLGFSPCPNDTFIFHALVHDLIEYPRFEPVPRLEDVETLNQLARTARIDVTKVSYGVLPYLLDEYTLLRSGGALGRGCGPLLVSRRPIAAGQLASSRIAIPGRFTTANLLLRLWNPDLRPGLELEYDRIMPAVAAGEVDAGLIIHESRFTYPAHGLEKVVDLGEWWEGATGSPIPLGAIVARRALGADIDAIDRAIRASLEYAFAHPAASADYVRRNAREMEEDVAKRHIDLYVNDFSLDLGEQGVSAVRILLDRAVAAGLVPASTMDPF